MWKYRNKEKMKKPLLTWEVAEGMNEGESKDPEGQDKIQLTWTVSGKQIASNKVEGVGHPSRRRKKTTADMW